ncbi:DUF4397 domain-containing protein [Mucilaginibacter boryungensis]|uniref:DUF4397 domain-containing protein n=1 Tax=Mucilaginibacter boryungensis TaxID=768480 RepID=A0ABR9XC62_9SPHI|nr:DUF4397 domain-containing protein [Mucilaginibacter boryungensis]MBE9664979.1 DUF4397 domain-containing protein [Mucilaginibacter boryungensis]
MKKPQQILKGAGMIGMVCLLAAMFSSCLKNHDNDDAVNVPYALVTVINTSPNSLAQDFYLDNNRANTAPIVYGDGLDYIRAYTGKRTAAFYNSGTSIKTISDTVTLKADQYYSVYLANVITTPDIVILKDNIVKPATGMATIRFVNLSPNAPAADLAIKGGAVLVSNKAYKGYSDFVPVNGNTTYTLEVRQTGTSTVLASINTASLQSGSVYTVWLQGLSGATDQTKLTAGLQTNVYYY